MNDPMKDIINRIVPPTPMFGEDEDEDEAGEADTGRPPLARRAGADDDAETSEISEEALDEAERNSEPDDDENDDARNLGDFDEQDYAGRIEGWAFKSLLLFVGDEELEVFYRRPRDAPGTVHWERIGHARSPDALDLRRLLYCAQQRDALEEEQGRREDLIESVFGAGSVPLIESLISRNGGDTAPGTPLTPRQEAFCRHYLTEPSGTRAAIKAGYSERSAANESHRLMRNDEILQRISALRRAHALSYALDRDTMLEMMRFCREFPRCGGRTRSPMHSTATRCSK